MISPGMRFSDAINGVFGSFDPARVRSRYEEPWRAYHAWAHPTTMKNDMREAERAGVRIVDGAATLAFILWHDAIYDPQAVHGRNETLSAMLCAREFGEIAHPDSTKRACRGIMATVGHLIPDGDDCPDAAIQLDCDLAILGKPPEVFDVYDKGIEFEYCHVPVETYATRRADILEGFLKRDRLYVTEWAHAQWEAQARENLRSRIDLLRSRK